MIDQGFKIVDFHSHFPIQTDWSGGRSSSPGQKPESALTSIGGEDRSEESEQALQEYAQTLRAEWRLAHGFEAPETEPQTEEELADRWAGEFDRYPLEKVVFVTGGGNDRLSGIVARHPDKFIGFAHHNPHEKGSGDELRRAHKDLGLKGYKLIAPALSKPIDDRSAYPAWEAAAELGIPVLIHFGILGGGGGIAQHVNMSPLMLHNVARDFATVPFVIPHLGCGYARELLQLMWACPNVYVDTSGSNQWIRWEPTEVTVKQLLRKYLETAGYERILFGSDSSWFPRGFSIKYLDDQIRDLREINVPQDQMEAILGGNARRLLGITGS